MNLALAPGLIAELLDRAAAAHPQECCGLLLGEGEAITALQSGRNVHPSPESRFEIDPQVLVDAHRAARKGGPQVLGYYHSHPNGLDRPSATDRAMAPADGAIWAIIAAGGVTFWRAGDAGFAALPYETTHR